LTGPTTVAPVPLMSRPVIGTVLVLAGLALLAVAVLGARSRLPRNRFAGVRTAAALRSDAAFVLANRVAAPLVGGAGFVGVAGGGVLIAGGPTGVVVVVLVVTVLGVLVLAGTGGVLGDRAAATLTAAQVVPACGGACAGCDLVAGCSGSALSG
jgi:uncharacterized membrane protein